MSTRIGHLHILLPIPLKLLSKQIGDRKVIMALSGGVDSTVAATLIHRAIGDRLYGIFVDNGVLTKR